MKNATRDQLQDMVGQLQRQRTDLVSYVRRTRKAISDFAPSALRGDRMDQAKAQMRAVVETTESAADVIMTCAEQLLAAPATETPEAYRTRVNEACMAIIEACAFQDLTGQRINKVATMLTMIETRLAALESELGEAFGVEAEDGPLASIDDVLLQGPALPNGGGITQRDVDAILQR
jgi:chemotaxis protein CheZ